MNEKKFNTTVLKIFAGIVLIAAAVLLFLYASAPHVKVQDSPKAEVGGHEVHDDVNEQYHPFSTADYVASTIDYQGESGIKYSIGSPFVSKNDEGVGMLALDPKAQPDNRKIGYYFTSNIGVIIGDHQSVSLTGDADERNYWLTTWNRDAVSSAKYVDDQSPGVCWLVENLGGDVDADIMADMNLYVRTVDLEQEQLLDSFKIKIQRNDAGQFAFVSAESSDISTQYPEYDRNWLIDSAHTFFDQNGSGLADELNKETGETEAVYYSPYDPLPEANRYCVELLTYDTLTPYVLTRTQEAEIRNSKILKSNQYPVVAVTPCYDNDTKELVTIYLYPRFLSGGNGVSYLGFSDFADSRCLPTYDY